jgi:predicted RNase H-like nuclease (RuvC/YqgF family)
MATTEQLQTIIVRLHRELAEAKAQIEQLQADLHEAQLAACDD